MRIAFFASSIIPVNAKTLTQRSLGGTESALVYLSEALDARGHEVFVFTPENNPPVSKPLYLPHRALQDLGEVDAFVAVREWGPVFFNVRCRKRFFWGGDSYDQPITLGLGDLRVSSRFDGMLCVSEWQARTISEHSGFPFNKMAVLRNGVNLKYFEGCEDRNFSRLVYTSTPFRGLEFLPKIFDAVRKAHPAAELHIFSGYELYKGAMSESDPRHAQFTRLKSDFEKRQGCFMHGNLLQSELAREYMKSAVFVYPNIFEETSCIVALEAQAGGCPVVTSRRGALPETLNGAGILIDGHPREDRYIVEFIDATLMLLNDRGKWQEYSSRGLENAKANDWSVIAERFESFVKS